MENASAMNGSIDLAENNNFDYSEDLESMNERPGTPMEIIEAAGAAAADILPEKSKSRYQQVYDRFQKWKISNSTTSNSERVFMAYFTGMAEKYSPSTLWSTYSMLKSMLKIDGVDIAQYTQLIAMLKKKTKGFVAKKAFTFEETEIKTFIDNAPDDLWLDVKVACAFSFFGACRTHELPAITVDMVAKYSDMYYITIPKESTKTAKENGFAITGALFPIVERYASLRPGKGKCTTQPIGKNKFYKFSTRVAKYLNLPNADRYTGHSFRRSSVTFVANTGASMEAIKRHSGHKSTSVCEGYIDNSIGYKKRTANAISSSLNCTITSSTADVPQQNGSNDSDNYSTATPTSSSSISNYEEPKSEVVVDENISPNCSTLTQSTTQNLMSKMEKFYFRQCKNLTFNFN